MFAFIYNMLMVTKYTCTLLCVTVVVISPFQHEMSLYFNVWQFLESSPTNVGFMVELHSSEAIWSTKRLYFALTLYSDSRGAAAVALTSSVCLRRTRITHTMATLTTSSKRPYHIIVFGATGFTGQFVVEEVARTCNEGPGGTLQWAVAGRNRDRLEKTLIQAADALCTCLTLCTFVFWSFCYCTLHWSAHATHNINVAYWITERK